MEHLLVGHVKLVVIFVQIEFADNEELPVNVLVLLPLIGLQKHCVQSGFVERGKLRFQVFERCNEVRVKN